MGKNIFYKQMRDKTYQNESEWHEIEADSNQENTKNSDETSNQQKSQEDIETFELLVLDPCGRAFEKKNFKEWKKSNPDPICQNTTTPDHTIVCPKCGVKAKMASNLIPFFFVEIC